MKIEADRKAMWIADVDRAYKLWWLCSWQRNTVLGIFRLEVVVLTCHAIKVVVASKILQSIFMPEKLLYHLRKKGRPSAGGSHVSGVWRREKINSHDLVTQWDTFTTAPSLPFPYHLWKVHKIYNPLKKYMRYSIIRVYFIELWLSQKVVMSRGIWKS
jgi:hypothetical protein